MAFLPPEQENQNAPQGQTTSNPQSQSGAMPPQVGGSAGSGTGTSKAGSPSSAGTPTQFGSSASKLGDYLTANAPQIQKQANTITGNLNNQYQQVGTDIGNAANQFGQSVQGGYTAGNQDLVNQATSNPTQFASDPNNVKGFQAQYNDSYTGPQNYESTTPYAGIQNEVSQAVQNAGLLNSQAGLQNYLAGTQGGNQTQASNTLDTLLLQGNPQARQQIQQAAGQFNNLTPQFQQSVTGADQSVTAAQQAAQQAQQYAQGQFGNTADTFNTGLNTELTNAQNQNTAYNAGIQNLLNTATPAYNVINQAPQTFSATPGASWFTSLANPIANDINLQPNINAPTLANVANANDYSEAAALQQLGGQAYTNPLNQADVSQAGTYQVPALPTQNVNSQLANYLNNDYFNALQKQENSMTGSNPYGEKALEQQNDAFVKNLEAADPGLAAILNQ